MLHLLPIEIVKLIAPAPSQLATLANVCRIWKNLIDNVWCTYGIELDAKYVQTLMHPRWRPLQRITIKGEYTALTADMVTQLGHHLQCVRYIQLEPNINGILLKHTITLIESIGISFTSARHFALVSKGPPLATPWTKPVHLHTNSVTHFVNTGQHIAVAPIHAPLNHAILEDQRYGWSTIDSFGSAPQSQLSLRYLKLTVFRPIVSLPFVALKDLDLHIHQIVSPPVLNAHFAALALLPVSLLALDIHLDFDVYDDIDSSANPAWSGTHLRHLTHIRTCRISVSRPIELFEHIVPRVWGLCIDISELSIVSAQGFGIHEQEHVDEMIRSQVDPDDSEFEDAVHDARIQSSKATILCQSLPKLRNQFPRSMINVVIGHTHHHIPPPYPPP